MKAKRAAGRWRINFFTRGIPTRRGAISGGLRHFWRACFSWSRNGCAWPQRCGQRAQGRPLMASPSLGAFAAFCFPAPRLFLVDSTRPIMFLCAGEAKEKVNLAGSMLRNEHDPCRYSFRPSQVRVAAPIRLKEMTLSTAACHPALPLTPSSQCFHPAPRLFSHGFRGHGAEV